MYQYASSAAKPMITAKRITNSVAVTEIPALGAAVIGVSWNAQSIAAENADIVAFSGEKLSRIADLFSEQKKYNRLLWQNIVIPFAFNGALLYTVMTGIFGSLLVSIGGAVLSGFALPIAFLMHESVSFLAAGNSMRGYLDSSRSLFPLFKRLISKAA
jgi:cation transport ATPase